MSLKQIRSEKGELMLEGVFSVTVTLIVMIFLSALGFWVYQKCVTSIVAREIAEEAAVTYKLRDIKTAEEEIDIADIKGIGSYRYLLFRSDFSEASGKQAEELAKERVRKANMAVIKRNPKVTVKRVGDDLGRTHYEVTVETEYTYLWGKLLDSLGYDAGSAVKSTVYVNSIDVSDYFNTVKFTKYAMNKATANDKVLSALNSVIKLIKTVADIFAPE